MKATVLSLTLLTVTGCSTLSSARSTQSTQDTQLQTSRLNTANTAILSQASPSSQASSSPQASPRFATDRQNQIDSWGYNEGKEDGRNNFPASFIGTDSHSLTDAAEKKIYTDAYTRGYADGKAQQPSPSPSPTSTVLPARRAELQQKGKQSGANDARSGFAANPDSSIAALGLTDPTEIQIYTDAYNAAYQQPTPTPTSSPSQAPGQLAQLRQQGYQDGYADAQSGLPKDADRGINLRGLVATADQRAYSNSYSNGYQKYLDEQGSVVGSW